MRKHFSSNNESTIVRRWRHLSPLIKKMWRRSNSLSFFHAVHQCIIGTNKSTSFFQSSLEVNGNNNTKEKKKHISSFGAIQRFFSLFHFTNETKRAHFQTGNYRWTNIMQMHWCSERCYQKTHQTISIGTVFFCLCKIPSFVNFIIVTLDYKGFFQWYYLIINSVWEICSALGLEIRTKICLVLFFLSFFLVLSQLIINDAFKLPEMYTVLNTSAINRLSITCEVFE